MGFCIDERFGIGPEKVFVGRVREMFEIQKVLAPTDLTEGSKAALPFAVQISHASGAELHLLHVTELHSEGGGARAMPPEVEVRSALYGEAGRLIDSLVEAGEKRLRVVTEDRRAVEAAPAIVEYADEIDADLIVMATHGRRGLGRLFIGSVTDEVLRHCSCPTLTLRDHVEISPSAQGRLIAAVDLDALSRPVLQAAARLSAWTGAEVEILHVVDPPGRTLLYEAYPELPVVQFEELEREVTSRIEELIGTTGLDPTRTTVHIAQGPTADSILKRAAALKPDLIVIGSHGRAGVDRVLLGSVAERVIQRSLSPVLTLKPGSTLAGDT